MSMTIVNISVTKPASNLEVSPLAVDTTAGTSVVWTLDASIAGTFNTAQPFAWHVDSVPPAGTCGAPALSNGNRTLTISFSSTVDLNLAYKLFVRLSNGRIASTAFGPLGTEPVGGGSHKIPPSSPKIKKDRKSVV